MKLFQIIQKNFALLGISSNQSLCNRQSVVAFSIYGFASIFSSAFLFFKANTFLEYTMNVFVTTTIFAIWIAFTVILFKKQNLFQLIDEFERLFDKSGYRRKNVQHSLLTSSYEMTNFTARTFLIFKIK